MPTLSIFCAHEQAETEQDIVVNPIDTTELIATCPCGRAIKFPNVKKAELNKAIAAHEAANFSDKPLISPEEAEAALVPKYL